MLQSLSEKFFIAAILLLLGVSPSFAAVAAGPDIQGITFEDVNYDGLDDVHIRIAFSEEDIENYDILQTSDGSYVTAADQPLAEKDWDFKILDVNEDGYIDVVISDDERDTFYLNNGDNTFNMRHLDY
ncbi:MAG: hypothetical protein C0624_11280 [Desulfuromonas sp.]|nr:MAG: hypothetical protein C0624_11280 [Desulfuromonas sp.]